jgi:hypothetical protein
MTDLLQAIATIIDHPIPDLLEHYQSKSKNRINAAGEILEEFIKDAFAKTLNETSPQQKNERYSQVFSWTGNQNNPPDFMIRNGDAVEIKKIESLKSAIALNSSYPKVKLHSNSPLLASACRSCEGWTEKDLIYTIGVMDKQQLKLLWFIYGDCYAASQEYYERINNQISRGINEITRVSFSETKELGRVNKVDPLGITYLRIRGMWGIQNPLNVFDYLNFDKCFNNNSSFKLIAILKESKYSSFSQESIEGLESLSESKKNLKISTQLIKCPDNPVVLLPAKIITYDR